MGGALEDFKQSKIQARKLLGGEQKNLGSVDPKIINNLDPQSYCPHLPKIQKVHGGEGFQTYASFGPS